jgi:hypothetical protein
MKRFLNWFGTPKKFDKPRRFRPVVEGLEERLR